MKILPVRVVCSMLAVAALSACTMETSDVDERATASLESKLLAFEALGWRDAQATYRDLPATSRAELWTASLERHLRSGTLTETERQVVTEALERLPAILTAEEQTVEAYGKELTTRIGEVRAKALFAELGKVARTSHGTRAAIDPTGGRGERTGVARSALEDLESLDGTTCNDRWYCGGCQCLAGFCYTSICSSACTATSSGCGWLLLQSCTSVETGRRDGC